MYSMCVMCLALVCCGPTYGHEPSSDDAFAGDARDPIEIAIDLYEQTHGQMIGECVERLYNTSFVEMDPDELAITCRTEKYAAAACYYENDSTPKVAIDYRDAANKRLRAHELMHVLLDCQSGSKRDGDGLHLDEVWDVLDPSAVGWSAKRREWH